MINSVAVVGEAAAEERAERGYVMPFVPPPAKEAPYRALPPHQVPLRVKLLTCFLTYLQFQFPGIVLGVAAILLAPLIEHERYAHSAEYRDFIWFMAGAVAVILGGVGLVAGLWRFLVIKINEPSRPPPA